MIILILSLTILLLLLSLRTSSQSSIPFVVAHISLPVQITYTDPNFRSKLTPNQTGESCLTLVRYSRIPHPIVPGVSYALERGEKVLATEVQYKSEDDTWHIECSPVKFEKLQGDTDVYGILIHHIFDYGWGLSNFLSELEKLLGHDPSYWEKLRQEFRYHVNFIDTEKKSYVPIIDYLFRHPRTHQIRRARRRAKELWEAMPEEQQNNVSLEDQKLYEKLV